MWRASLTLRSEQELQSVALKFLLPEAIANAEASSRFLREARNAVRLRSEHVARVIDVEIGTRTSIRRIEVLAPGGDRQCRGIEPVSARGAQCGSIKIRTCGARH